MSARFLDAIQLFIKFAFVTGAVILIFEAIHVIKITVIQSHSHFFFPHFQVTQTLPFKGQSNWIQKLVHVLGKLIKAL